MRALVAVTAALAWLGPQVPPRIGAAAPTPGTSPAAPGAGSGKAYRTGSGSSGEPDPDSDGLPVDELPELPKVTSDEDTVLAITLAGARRVGEEVVVGAAKREQSLGSVASAVTVISGDRLRRFGYRTLAEALGSIVGLYVVDDRMIARVGIRGLQLLGDANTRILVLIDGSPVNEPWSQGSDAGYALPIHIDDVARIEIIRGPVSSIYGTNAFFAIVNVVSIQADNAAGAYARATAGTHRGDLVSGINAGFSSGDLNRQLRATFSWTRNGGETIRIEPFAGLPATDPDVSADGLGAMNGSLVITRDHLFAQLRAHSRRRELPGAPFDSKIGSDDNTILDRLILSELGYTRPLAEQLSLTGRAYLNRYQHRTDLAYSPFPAFRTDAGALWYGGEVRALFDLSEYMPLGTLDLTCGLAAEKAHTHSDSFEVGSARRVSVDRAFSILGAYAELQVAPRRWITLTAGVRHDRNSIFENALSPRTALFLRHRDRFGLKLLYARGFRNPSVLEAFFEDERRFRPTCAPECDTIGTTLSPERISSYEAVVWGRLFPGLKARLSAWSWVMDNIIEKTRVRDPETDREVIQHGNIFTGLSSRGVELEASYRDTQGWVAYASTTFTSVERGSAPSSNAPRHMAKFGVSTPLLGGWTHLSTEAAYIGSRINTRRDAPVSADVPAYLGWNAAAYLPAYHGFDVSFGIRNILGTREQIPVQGEYDRTDPDAEGPLTGTRVLMIPGPGRELFVRVGYRH